MKYDILIVEDEEDIRAMVAGILSDEGYDVREASSSDEVFAAVKSRRPSLVVLDVWLKGSAMDGIEVLDSLKVSHPNLPVIVISGHGTVETAVSAIRKGAFDYIVKPFKAEKLLVTVGRALENARLRQENEELKGKAPRANKLVGTSTHITQLRHKIAKIAPTNSRILISGPSGSGKELIARLMHAQSGRANGPFKAVGTLYLDEVADMPLETQGKLLRLLVEQRFQRIGGEDDVQVDVRVVTSTSRDLETESRLGRFREDLYHRLNVMPLEVSALSERREDIPELVEYFIEQLAASTGLPPRKIGDDAMAALQAHDWPGNVRQLRNNVERLLILATGDPTQPITLETLPSEVSVVRSAGSPRGRERVIAMPLRDAREHFEREYLQAQIERFGGNISKTAAFVGMERSALHRKLKSLGVQAGNRTADSSPKEVSGS